MVHLQLGSTYEFTLASGRKILLVVLGSKQQPMGKIGWEIEINGTKEIYPGINEALGESFTQIRLIP